MLKYSCDENRMDSDNSSWRDCSDSHQLMQNGSNSFNSDPDICYRLFEASPGMSKILKLGEKS